MSRDRITQIRIRGLRVIEDLTLDLDGLLVLIGDNGSGKSTILEAFEILRLAAAPGSRFPDDPSRRFGPFEEWLRFGASELTLGVCVEGQGQLLEYSLTVSRVGQREATIARESLTSKFLDSAGHASEPKELVSREGNRVAIRPSGPLHQNLQEALDNVTGGTFTAGPNRLVLASFDELPASPALRRVRDALLQIELHVPFEVRPPWQAFEWDLRKSARHPNELTATAGLERYGNNLVNCFHTLRDRGEETWERVLDRARLALGRSLRDFGFPPFGRGFLDMEAKFADLPDPVPIRVMSEGQLAFLSLIALVELGESRPILLFDEPEVHLHPALQVNALYLLERAAESCPVVLATHSDRLLDALEDPAQSVALCELDERRSIRLLRPDPEKLARWLERYRGLGSLRAEGYDAAIFDP